MSADNAALFLAAALQLAQWGMYVFPLARGTKVPLAGSHGYFDATIKEDEIRQLWQQRPRLNIGIATGSRSRVWVLDIDRQHGGLETLASLEAEHGPLPLSIEASTPSGGKHLYFRWPDGGPEIRCSQGRVGPGIDVLGEGCSVVAPPSTLADGRRYCWVEKGAQTFALAPGWLIALTPRPPLPPCPQPKPLAGNVTRYVAKAVGNELAALDRAQPGTRHTALNRCAFVLGRFIGAGVLPEDWAAEELVRRACAIGLPIHEARGTVADGLRAGKREPRPMPT